MRENEDADYRTLVTNVRETPVGFSPVFNTRAPDYPRYDLFLAHLPQSRRKHYECRHCRYFVNRFGGMVSISPAGVRESVLWNPRRHVPHGFFGEATSALRVRVEAAPVTGLFLECPPTLAASPTPKAWGGTFYHMHLPRPVGAPAARVAQVTEDRRMLAEAAFRYRNVASVARDLLRTGAGDRQDKTLPMAEWLVQVVALRNTDALWLAAANAPAGFCHVKNTVLGTLLEDLLSGKADPLKSYNAKVAPLAYQRPQAAPTAGAIDRAEQIFAASGYAPSLERRYATLEDVASRTLWAPAKTARDPGVFAHLRPAAPAASATPYVQTVTWRKFRNEVLPHAATMAYQVPLHLTAFFAFVTAAHPEAPCLLQWGNHVNWYMYHQGSPSARWGLSAGSWVDVRAVVPQPNTWHNVGGRPVGSFGDGAYFILKDARDQRPTNPGLGLFPEELRGDLREVRSVIEAASKAGRISDPGGPLAQGIAFQSHGKSAPVLLRVGTASGTLTTYQVDRWD